MFMLGFLAREGAKMPPATSFLAIFRGGNPYRRRKLGSGAGRAIFLGGGSIFMEGQKVSLPLHNRVHSFHTAPYFLPKLPLFHP